MPPLSLPNRIEIASSLFALVVAAVIALGVFWAFRANGVPVRLGYGWEMAAVFGYCVLRTVF